MIPEMFLRRHNYDPLKPKQVMGFTGITIPILCRRCRRVFEVELRAKFIVGEDGSEAITSIVSPTDEMPFTCEDCSKGEHK